jgi:hypothetical protein
MAISARFLHQAFHFRHRLFQAAHHRTANNRVADVQLMHFRQRGNGLHVMVGQAVTGINLQPQAGGIGRRFGNTLQLFCLLSVGFASA